MAISRLQGHLRVRRRRLAPVYWAVALTSVWLRVVHPEDAANWYVRKAMRIEVVEP